MHFVIYLAQDAEARYVSSVREVVDAEGPTVVSNEVFRPGPDGRAVPSIPFRSDTLDQLAGVGFDPGLLDRPQGWWERSAPSPPSGAPDSGLDWYSSSPAGEASTYAVPAQSSGARRWNRRTCALV